MVVIPAGGFMMGSAKEDSKFDDISGTSDDNKFARAWASAAVPQHSVVFVNRFAISRFEVTAEQWETCVHYGGCTPGGGTGTQPITSVSWHDAKYYVAWLSKMTGQVYRLASEAEWEYAARAGSATNYSWGNEVQQNGRPMANCSNCGSEWDGKDVAPVGSFKPNKFGIYDMHGNAFEWTEDSWHPDYNGAPADGSAWIEGGTPRARVIRGGSAYFDSQVMTLHLRSPIVAVGRDAGIGFRVARTLIDPAYKH
jgi:formylglycine-generating enzyme required for sulfatase activity